MPFRKDKEAAAKGPAAVPAQPKGSDLLMRFFESEWFDCFIALTYLYKSQSAGVQDYLCNRLYGLPEPEVERYLAQLCQLSIERPSGNSLERVIIDLCAQSLRIAVKAYWLLLAISQDMPKDAHVAALRDACEQAALQGHWQLPFKQSRLPAPLGSPMRRPSSSRVPSGAAFSAAGPSPMVSPNGSFTHMQRPGWGVSPDPLARRGTRDGQQLSSDGGPGEGSRPMSPDGLGGGLYSSVFMDTGVEGLIYGSPPPDLRAVRQHVAGSPRASQGALLEGSGHPLLPVRTAPAVVDAQRVSSLQEELGAGEGVSALLLRSSTAGEGGRPGVVQQADEGASAAAAAAAAAAEQQQQLFSPPNSPRRRQTTFGATLDFVETLCQASASLTAFQPEDRQWALRRALQQINLEIEKASRNGVAIWFPMGDANLRVVRLASRESRLLNSREKAPFTLCVEVLDEAEAAAAVEARAAAAAAEVAAVEAAAAAAEAAAAAAAAAALLSAKDASDGSGSYADSAQSMAAAQLLDEDAAVAAAAAEAAASGIRFLANHHRTVSMDTAQFSDTVSTHSDGSLDAAALAAVQGSSAMTGDAVAAATATPRRTSTSSASGASSLPASGGSSEPGEGLGDEPSFAGMLSGAVAEAAGSPAARPRRLTDDLDAVSEVPSCSDGSLGGSPGLTGSSCDTPGSHATPSSVRFDQQLPSTLPPLPHGQQPQQQPDLPPSDQRLQQQLAALRLGSPKQPGAGTWIGGGSLSPASAAAAAAAGSSRRRFSGSSKGKQTSGDLVAALAGLRGEAPLVSVRLEVINDRPFDSARSTSSSQAEGTPKASGAAPGTPDSSSSISMNGSSQAAASSAERRRASLDAAARAPPHVCDRSSWACKLGLCKLCNAKLATMGDEDDAPWLQPHVKLHFTVQGGVDLSIRKTPPKHQRVPSHEAILKVAKQHKLPPPVLTAPQQQHLELPQQVAPAAEGSQQQQEQIASLSGAPRPCLPVFRPASASSPLGGRQAVSDAEAQQQAAAQAASQAVYGEAWQARKERVQLASPHGRRPGWDLRCVIVKTGDDCRQELLAMQLIRAFHEIFGEARLPLWLRPYEVLPTSNRTALIEMVPNAPSIHALKSKSPPGTSLRDHFIAKCGGAGTPAFVRAQRCFAESLAAYSLVCYLLQIKDRHNGNILLDDEGHVIHIDFGFMLSNSPGGVNFESAPFKLTRELLEVMDSDSEGRASELFDYFKVLMIQGFLAVRKHADRILLLAEMMQGSGCPCFKNRVAAVQGLKKRFHLALPEPQVIEVVLGLISDSLDNWRTRQYDAYQRVLNSIL